MSYWTYRFRYKAKGQAISVFAREQKTADEIIAIENADNAYVLKRRIFGFKKRCEVTIPPYELELAQMEETERRLARRRERKKK